MRLPTVEKYVSALKNGVQFHTTIDRAAPGLDAPVPAAAPLRRARTRRCLPPRRRASEPAVATAKKAHKRKAAQRALVEDIKQIHLWGFPRFSRGIRVGTP